MQRRMNQSAPSPQESGLTPGTSPTACDCQSVLNRSGPLSDRLTLDDRGPLCLSGCRWRRMHSSLRWLRQSTDRGQARFSCATWHGKPLDEFSGLDERGGTSLKGSNADGFKSLPSIHWLTLRRPIGQCQRPARTVDSTACRTPKELSICAKPKDAETQKITRRSSLM